MLTPPITKEKRAIETLHSNFGNSNEISTELWDMYRDQFSKETPNDNILQDRCWLINLISQILAEHDPKK